MSRNPVKLAVGLVSDEGCSTAAKHARIAEEGGLDYVFVSDHPKGRNTYVCLTTIATETRTICIGPGVTNPYLIHPATTAQILASLDDIAPGRIVCGIGAGDRESLRRLGVEQSRPVSTVEKATQIIRSILTGEKARNKEDSKTHQLGTSFRPVNFIPIFIGAQGDLMLRLAGKIGDGVIVNTADPAECKRAFGIVKQGRLNTEVQQKGFEWAAEMPFSVAKIPEDALRPLKPKVAVIASGSPDTALERHGISAEDRDAVRKALRRGDHAAMVKAVTPEMIDALSITGTPETCIEKVRRLIQIGATTIVFGPPLGHDVSEAIKMISDEIRPTVS